MESTAEWHAVTDKYLNLSGNFSFYQVNAATWEWGVSPYVRFIGQTKQKMEVGGRDYGLSNAGFDYNFNLGKLEVANTGTYLTLVDEINNGHRASPEALYADALEVLPGSVLNLNGLHLYTKLGGNIHWVKAGEGRLFGGGLIFDKASTAVLLLLLLE